MIITGLDLETTGLDQAKGHRIIEVAMILFDLSTRAEKLRYVQRVNPQRTIDAKAFEVHHISSVDLADKPTWDKIAPKVAKVLEKTDILVAHNGDSFDFPFVGEEMIRVDVDIPPVRTFDTMTQGLWATPTGKVPRLGELCFACDVAYDPEAAHAADYDVERMMECLWFGIDQGFFNLDKKEEA